MKYLLQLIKKLKTSHYQFQRLPSPEDLKDGCNHFAVVITHADNLTQAKEENEKYADTCSN